MGARFCAARHHLPKIGQTSSKLATHTYGHVPVHGLLAGGRRWQTLTTSTGGASATLAKPLRRLYTIPLLYSPSDIAVAWRPGWFCIVLLVLHCLCRTGNVALRTINVLFGTLLDRAFLPPPTINTTTTPLPLLPTAQAGSP